MDYPTIWPQFFTATIQNWKKVLKEDEYKGIILEALQFLVKEKRIELNAFVLMDTHIHLIWQPLGKYTLTEIQRSFMTKTANDIKKKLMQENPKLLAELKVNKPDRTYQVWKRSALSIELFTEKAFLQKLGYIHQNPVAAGLVAFEEEYKYSSARFYMTGEDEYGLLTHYSGN